MYSTRLAEENYHKGKGWNQSIPALKVKGFLNVFDFIFNGFSLSTFARAWSFLHQTLRREELFVTSKLWNTKHDPEDVEDACRTSLAHLGLSYLDLYLMHWPMAFQ